MARNFYRAKCEECGNEQIIFSRASTDVECLVCGTVVATPTGGKAELNAEVVENLEVD